MRLNRRKFLQVSAGVATAMALTSKKVGAQLKPVVDRKSTRLNSSH